MEAGNETSTLFMNLTTKSYDINRDTPIEIFQGILIAVTIAIMFGMGCAVELEVLRPNLKRPVALCYGLVFQIFFMPLVTIGLIALAPLSPIQGIAFMLVGCSPGGTNSNIFTYLVDGDISLSVSMTIISNLISLGTVPLWMFLYSLIYPSHGDDELEIPYVTLVGILSATTIVIAIGILVRYKFPERVRRLPKIFAVVGLIVTIITVVTLIIITKLPFFFTVGVLLPVGALPIIGMIVPYFISFIPQLNFTSSTRKAIAIEISVQHGGLANMVIILTYGTNLTLLGSALPVPLLYSAFQASYTTFVIIVFQIWKWRMKESMTS